jgi:hypothetical protein
MEAMLNTQNITHQRPNDSKRNITSPNQYSHYDDAIILLLNLHPCLAKIYNTIVSRALHAFFIPKVCSSLLSPWLYMLSLFQRRALEAFVTTPIDEAGRFLDTVPAYKFSSEICQKPFHSYLST